MVPLDEKQVRLDHLAKTIDAWRDELYDFDGSAVARTVHDAGWRATAASLVEETVAFVPK